jgi:hypothetical protein
MKIDSINDLLKGNEVSEFNESNDLKRVFDNYKTKNNISLCKEGYTIVIDKRDLFNVVYYVGNYGKDGLEILDILCEKEIHLQDGYIQDRLKSKYFKI